MCDAETTQITPLNLRNGLSVGLESADLYI